MVSWAIPTDIEEAIPDKFYLPPRGCQCIVCKAWITCIGYFSILFSGIQIEEIKNLFWVPVWNCFFLEIGVKTIKGYLSKN